MLLPIKSQGFPNLISELGIQSPLVGPFWNFESTVLPIIDVRGVQVVPGAEPPYTGGAATAGILVTPAALAFLAQTNAVFNIGSWALYLSWSWVNASANTSYIYFRQFNDTFTVVLETEVLDVIGAAGTSRATGSGSRILSLDKRVFGNPWALQNSTALATAGSQVSGVIRARYLGDIPALAGF